MDYGDKITMELNSFPVQNSYWVIPGRFRAGEHPGRGFAGGTRLKLHWLVDLGLNYIVDLTESGEADINYPTALLSDASPPNVRVTYKRFPIPDWSAPSQEKVIEILDAIDLALAEGRNIYLHCYGGKGRTGTLVGCYLVRHGTPGDRALEMIQEFRREIPEKEEQSPETDEQRRMVMEWTKGQ